MNNFGFIKGSLEDDVVRAFLTEDQLHHTWLYEQCDFNNNMARLEESFHSLASEQCQQKYCHGIVVLTRLDKSVRPRDRNNERAVRPQKMLWVYQLLRAREDVDSTKVCNLMKGVVKDLMDKNVVRELEIRSNFFDLLTLVNNAVSKVLAVDANAQFSFVFRAYNVECKLVNKIQTKLYKL